MFTDGITSIGRDKMTAFFVKNLGAVKNKRRDTADIRVSLRLVIDIMCGSFRCFMIEVNRDKQIKDIRNPYCDGRRHIAVDGKSGRNGLEQDVREA